MKRLFFFLVGIIASAALWAVPADPTVFTVTQADGTTIVVRQVGDEWFHFYVNVETGERLVADENMNFRPMTEAEFSQRRGLSRLRRSVSASRRAPMRANTLQDRTSLDLHGKRKALVLLVNFSDVAYAATAEYMNRQMNETGFSENGHIGSVRDYFLAQSYGQFELDIDVVGPIDMPKSMAYYGSNTMLNGDDAHPGEMVAEACKKAHEEGVNFADYDWDGDGEVEMVTVIYAGYGEAQSRNPKNIWPHQWYLSATKDVYDDGEGALRFDGITVDKYLVLNELNGGSGADIDGIGTFCHEFSHSLDLPDIYDVNYLNFGMGSWSIMDSGCYNGGGSVPCGYTAYERKFCGWLDPVELNEGKTVKDMPALNDESVAYIVYNDATPSEYYLLYNVQQTGWDVYAPGHGMLIMHVDYDADTWYNNLVNVKESHQRVTIFHADNQSYRTVTGYRGDPFPGTSGTTEFTDESLPKATLYNPNVDNSRLMHKPVTAIAEDYESLGSGRISFKFMGGDKVYVETPSAPSAENVEKNAFTIVWPPVSAENVTYNLELTVTSAADAEAPADALLLSADFAPGDGSLSDASAQTSGSGAPRIEKRVIAGIAETRYEITGIPDDCECNFRVQAMDAERNLSEWSEVTTLCFGSFTGIDHVSADLGQDNGHENAGHRQAFDLQGRHVAKGFRHGICIENGKKIVKQ